MVRRVCNYVSGLGLAPELVPMDAAALRRHPACVEPVSVVSGRNNVVIRLPGRGKGRSLIFNCHLDIQPEGDAANGPIRRSPAISTPRPIRSSAVARWTTRPASPSASVSCGVIVERVLQFDGDLVFQFVLEDEITGNGSLACLEAGHVADAAVIVDGTRPDRANDQHAGNMEFHVSLKGRPASVSVSHLGVNAAELLLRSLLHLREAFYRLNSTRAAPWTQFPSPYQFVVHGMQADAPRFSVPVDASARCFVTFAPPTTIADVRTFLEAESSRHAKSADYPHAPVFAWNGFAAEPVACAHSRRRAATRSCSDAAKRNGIPDVLIGPSTGTSDLRHFISRGIPCLLYGPGPRLQSPPRGRAFSARRSSPHDEGLSRHGHRVV